MVFGVERFRVRDSDISWSRYREGGGGLGCMELIRGDWRLFGFFRVCE